MAGLDVICIGAVNYDYMFHCAEEDLFLNDNTSGKEDLGNTLAAVEGDILELIAKNRIYATQIGGSAFNTLKAIKFILPGLKGAYVGACGTPNTFDMQYGKSNDIESELAHLDNRDWLFASTDDQDAYSHGMGKGIVRLYNHTRNCIKITACANNTLLGRILEKEEQTGESLVDYLKEARWIHLSSLSDFDQWEGIMKRVIKAKELNPDLKISVDPGFEFTSRHRDRLQPLIAHADYIFLNNSERRNLALHAENEDAMYTNLDAYFSAYIQSSERKLIVKHEDSHEIIHFENKKWYIDTLPHEKLSIDQIHNDTGAGDSFAGGFISAMLYEPVKGDIAKAIRMGVIAAAGRMKSFDHEDPYLNIQKFTNDYIKELNR